MTNTNTTNTIDDTPNLRLPKGEWERGSVRTWGRRLKVYAKTKDGLVSVVYDIDGRRVTFAGVERVVDVDDRGETMRVIEHRTTPLRRATWLRLYKQDAKRRALYR